MKKKFDSFFLNCVLIFAIEKVIDIDIIVVYLVEKTLLYNCANFENNTVMPARPIYEVAFANAHSRTAEMNTKKKKNKKHLLMQNTEQKDEAIKRYIHTR